MKGLIRQSLYATEGNLRMSLIAIIAFGIVMLFTRNMTFMSLFLIAAAAVCPIGIASSVQADATAKWNKFEITMPVRRRDIVRSKYIAYLLMVAMGTVIGAMVLWATVWFSPDTPAYDMVTSLLLGACFSLGTGVWFFPLIYILGADKSESIFVLSFLGSGLVFGGLALLLSSFIPGISYGAAIRIMSLVCLALYAVSNLIATKAYECKEF